MTSTTGGSPAEPNVSYAISMPLALTYWVSVVIRQPYARTARAPAPRAGALGRQLAATGRLADPLACHGLRAGADGVGGSGARTGDEVALLGRVRGLRVRALGRDRLRLLHRLADGLQLLAPDGLADLREHLLLFLLD